MADATTSSASPSVYLYWILGIAVVGALLYGVYWYVYNSASGAWKPLFKKLSNQTTLYDGKVGANITGADIPPGVQDYGLQAWVFIKDWNYRFGSEKVVLQRIDPSSKNAFGPKISLAPTDNTLNVTVSLFPTDANAPTSTPAPANQGGSSTGDTFTWSVENVPQQSWFSLSTTVFQRNLDIYINGRLVKSCVLPGVPKPAVGDIILNDAGGFSGSLCNVHSYSGMLSPADAKAFFSAGTSCAAPAPTIPSAPATGDTFVTLFGYTFRFATIDKGGKELSSYTF
jgi:hypothetical protein